MNNNNSTHKRFEALDAFRGICALAVVVYHTRLIGSMTELAFFRGSAIFVEFFFVLSGFVLAHGYGYRSTGLQFQPFMLARLRRLYPLHLFMFLVFFALEIGKLLAYKLSGFVFNNPPFTNYLAFREILPNLLLIHAWVPFADHYSYNYPSWSISIEFYLYALLFVSIMGFRSRQVLVWTVASLFAFGLMLMDVASGIQWLPTQVVRGLACFFGGAMTYAFYRKISHWQASRLLGSIVETGLLIAVLVVVCTDFAARAVLAPALFFVTVLCFAFEAGIFSGLLSLGSMQYIGKLSYSIYMTHAAILFCLISVAMVLQKASGIEMAPMIDGTRFLDFGSDWLNTGVALFIAGIVMYISSLTYKFVEVPGQQLRFKRKAQGVSS